MPVHINPLVQAIRDMRAARNPDGTPVYQESEIQSMINEAGFNEKELNLLQPMRSIEGTKPVTTLKTIEDENMALEAPGGPILTAKQRETNAQMEKQIQEKARRQTSTTEHKG